MTFSEFQKEQYGYDCITTFWEDFSIADHFGLAAVKDTFNRAFAEWKNNYKYLTELVIVLNHKCWLHYHKEQQALSQLYSDLYYKARDYAEEHLKSEEFEYYFNITD